MRTKIAMALIAAATLVPALGQAQEADVSANFGWVSEYYYRGIPQNSSSASAGLDVAVGGFYVGTWAADVDEGNEVDLYAGYTQEFGEAYLGVGGTGYFYTGDFDDTYLEANLTGGFGPLGVEFSLGQYDSDPEQDYTFLGVTLGHGGAYGTFGTFGGDFTGSYGEVGYGITVSDIDLSVAWIFSDEDLSGLGKSDNTLVFGLGYALDLNGD